MARSRTLAIVAGATGLGLAAWILFDASSVSSALRLNTLVDEAAVALVGLTFAGACCAAAAILLRRPEVDAHAR